MIKIGRKLMATFMIVLLICSLFFTSIVKAKQLTINEITDTNYDYSNSIYDNGLEDTNLLETTDSVITTKTGLTRTKTEVFGKYNREEYPIPNVSKPGSEEKFNLIKEENIQIMNQVEEDIKNGTLKKHIAADGQFYGTVSDEAKAVEKIVYVNSNLKGSHSLAVYIPAGEIATIQIPDEYLYLVEQKAISIKVGLTETNADSYSKNNGKENRMPRLGKSFSMAGTQTKVGTPFGGMVYLQINTNVANGITIPVTVTGGIDTPYYDFGATTKEQWEQAKNAPGLYAEFRTPYMRFMLPSSVVRNLQDPYDALSFWNNVAALSTYSFGAQTRTLPITMVFDPYVKAGAAVATVGAWICNMPTGWATSSLNYESIMKGGCWGTIHEFNHHWQGTYAANGRWGVGYVEEVTNNVMNAASYILYTNIAAYRTTSGLDDWNVVADPYTNLKKVLAESNNNTSSPVTSVFMYTSFMHEFGVQNFLEVVKSNYSGGTYHGVTLKAYDPAQTRYDDFAYRTSVVMGKDLSYYFKDVLHFDLTTETIHKIKSLGFEPYIPVQNLYATGVKGIETGRTFYLPYGDYTFDFNQYMTSPGAVKVIDVSQTKYGNMIKKEDGVFVYEPNENLPANAIEEFDLTIEVTANGVKQTRVLACKIGFEYANSKIEKYSIVQNNIDQAISLAKTEIPYQVVYSKTVNYTTDDGKNLTKGTGYFEVAKDGDYEFQAYGDDQAKLFVIVDGKEYTSQNATYTGNANTAYNQTNSTHFTVSLKANTAYYYELYINNAGGSGYGGVGYRQNNTGNFQNLPSPCLKAEDFAKKPDKSFPITTTPYYKRPLTNIGSKIITDMSKAQVLKTPNAQAGDGNNANSIIDGNKNTFFHSKYSGGGITAFPHDYIIDLGEEKIFNKIDVYTRANNTNGTIGDYEIYIANEYQEEETKWTKIVSDETRKNNNNASTTISNKVDLTKARYIKIRALNNKFGSNFTIISEVEVSVESNVKEKIAQNSSKVLYQGNWIRNTEGNYINGATYNSTNGKLFYGFEGTETAIYSAKDAVVKIKVDKEEAKIYTLKGSKYSPSVILNGYSNGSHVISVEVVAGELAFNMATTDGKFIAYHEPTDSLTIQSSVYKIREDQTITKIVPNTNVETFISNIQTNANSVEILDKDGKEANGNITTGMILNLNKELQYVLIVIGDVNEDGNLDIVDLSILNKTILGIKQLNQQQILAGDLNFDNKNDIVDISILNKVILGLKQLNN